MMARLLPWVASLVWLVSGTACAPQLQANPTAALASPTKVQAGGFGGASAYVPDAAYVESLVQRAHAVQRFPDPFAADRFQEVIQGAGFKGADGMLVVSRHDHDHRKRPLREFADYVEAAQSGHFQVEQDDVGL